uniref:RecA family profile 1 domain-containing protein n=1 Tax=Aureoumbra lagunensis TaxID=44058 RepID=A0A7S3NIS9_9STRA|mmetsp:Transcript_3006/g.3922  ORF Transcript_3006/g.3922 Transcript_3006/m.3922 type:complete len:348 (+) Transcript_3006:83-1126(+)
MPRLSSLEPALDASVINAFSNLKPAVHTVEALLEREVEDLRSEELSREKVIALRQQLASQILPKECINWSARIEVRSSLTEFLSTGNVAIDALLGGGIRRGEITELQGECGSGKTSFCLTVAALAAKNKLQVIWIDGCTCGFDAKRLRDIAACPESLGNVRRCFASDVFEAIAVIDEDSSDLLILDSPQSLLAPNIGAARLGHFALSALGHALTRRAKLQHSAVLITNGSVRSGFSSSSFNAAPVENEIAEDNCKIPALGLSWSYVATVRLRLSSSHLVYDENKLLNDFILATNNVNVKRLTPFRQKRTVLLDRHSFLAVFPPKSVDFFLSSRGLLDATTGGRFLSS